MHALDTPSPSLLFVAVSLRRFRSSVTPSSFPPTIPWSDACVSLLPGTPSSSAGSLRVGYPASSVPSSALTTDVLPSGSVSLAFGTTRASSTLRSLPAQLAYLVGPGIGSTGCSLSGGLRVETTVPPKFLGNPNVSAPRSLTPLGSPALLASTRQLLPARSPNGTTSGLAVSGLDHAAHSLPVYASQRLSPMPPRKTRFQRSPTLLGGSSYPLGFGVRFQSICAST